ncbi:MAG: insulinase family protein [Halanaerobiaceae bacterium]|nr:insulinase family protein [Halanaerobiaceae bacterium]
MENINCFKHLKTDNDMELYICKTKKFKTNLLQIFILNKLDRETVSKNALVPFILYRGSEKYPDSKSFKIQLDYLYGAELNVSVWKRGELQIINFSLEIVNEKYLPTDEKLNKKAILLLKELVLSPRFTEEYFQQERDFIIKEIKSIKNDKYTYSLLRCYQEMCRNEPFGLHKLGHVEDHERLNREDVYEQYQRVLTESRILFFVIGDIDEDALYDGINNSFDFKHKQDRNINQTYVKSNVAEIKEIEEKMNVNQGKLVMGFRTGITRNSHLYYPLLMYNGILGSFPHSKLFQSVREKESLAYYVSSNIETTKGLLIITSGIAVENYEKTRKLIMEQVEKMKNGDISDDEFNWTRASLISTFKTMADSNRGLSSHYLLGLINDQPEPVPESIDRLNAVKKEDLVEVANRISLDTIYFLNKKG